MSLIVRTSWTNTNPKTIWNCLAAALGRDPTPAEVKAKIHQIMESVLVDRAEAGKLAHQKHSWPR